MNIKEDSLDDVCQILTLLATGLTDRAVASQLHISHRTVERRVAKMMARFGLQSRFQLAILALRLGLIEVGQLPSNTQRGTLDLPIRDLE